MPLLSVFAGGCLSGAALLSFWRGESQVVPAARHAAVERAVAAPSPPVPSSAPELPTREHAADRPASPPHSKDHEDVADGAPTEPGSSVADVLLGLEAEYRQRLAAARAAEQPAAPLPAPPQPTAAIPEAPAPAALAQLPAPVAPAVALAAPAPPIGVPAIASAPPVEAAPVLAARDTVQVRDVRVGDVHVGDVHQSTSASTVNHGDVYLMQQLALLQSLNLYGLTPYLGVAPPAHAPRGTTRRAPPFATSLTNPDNPWGFDFPPTVLVK